MCGPCMLLPPSLGRYLHTLESFSLEQKALKGMQISPKTRRPIEVRFRHYMKLQDGGGMPVLC